MDNVVLRVLFYIGIIFLLIVVIFALIGAVIAHDRFGIIFVSVILLALIIWLVRKYLKHRKFEQDIEYELQMRERLSSQIDKYINGALEIMDGYAKWYNNEEEANKELILLLKSKGLDATYQFELGDGIVADGKVGDFLIEGKLDPGKSEIDRLIGQLESYSRYPYKVNVVIYGKIDIDQLRRITEHIDKHYPGKVFLSNLDSPNRRGRQNRSKEEER